MSAFSAAARMVQIPHAVAEIERRHLSYLYIHVKLQDSAGRLCWQRNIEQLKLALLGIVDFEKFQGRYHFSDRVVAVWPSEYEGSLNAAMVDLSQLDLELVYSWPGVIPEATHVSETPFDVPDTARFNPNWRIID